MAPTGKTGPLAAFRGLAIVAAAATFLAGAGARRGRRRRQGGGDHRRDADHRERPWRRRAGIRRAAAAQIPPEQQRSALIDVLIDIRLVAKAAETAGLDKSKDVAPKLAFARDQTLRSEYLSAKVVAGVTDDAVKKRFDEEIAKFVPADEVHARHILVKTEDEAKAIIADLDKGGDFATIAKEKSLDPGSGPQGGDLGFIGRSEGKSGW